MTLAIFCYLLILMLIAFISFGGALFVIEGPYIKPITAWVEKKYSHASIGALIVKGLRCYTCLGFNFGMLATVYLQLVSNVKLFPTDPWQFIFCMFMTGLLGSGFSTTGAYLIALYFEHLDNKGIQ
jgi:hypothetical protein